MPDEKTAASACAPASPAPGERITRAGRWAADATFHLLYLSSLRYDEAAEEEERPRCRQARLRITSEARLASCEPPAHKKSPKTRWIELRVPGV